MANRKLQLPEAVHPGMRQGRNINHDPQSFAYRVAPRKKVTPKSVAWTCHIPVLDQGDVGSCVANTGTELLGCDPFWSTLDASTQKVLLDATKAEAWAQDLYRELTRSDTFPGSWEPDDTGSDGLTLGKVLTKRKMISGYRHGMSVDDAHVALQAGPFAFGTIWTEGMFNPSREGIVTVSGKSAGGHEILCHEYDLTRDLWWFRNHWTASWGLKGRFAIDTPTFASLLSQQGDVTVPVPVSQPAPQPSPIVVNPSPAPQPTPTLDPLADFPWGSVDDFLNAPHGYRAASTAAKALNPWVMRWAASSGR